MGVADADLAQRTAVSHIANNLQNSALSLANTIATGLAAGAPRTPVAESAASRARTSIAGTRLNKVRARLAAVLGEGLDRTSASRDALAAARGAGAPLAPIRDLTVNGAVLKVAVNGLEEAGAGLAVVSGGHDDGTLASLGTTTAALRAGAPLRPRAHCAVTRAGLSVAGLSLADGTTGSAPSAARSADRELRVDQVARALLSTTTASRSAGTPVAPGRELAVRHVVGAVGASAGDSLNEGRAGLATVTSGGQDSASAETEAITAVGRTLRPGTETRDHAVLGTFSDLALDLLGESATGASVGRGKKDSAVAERDTSTARSAAGRPVGPRRQLTVAGLLVGAGHSITGDSAVLLRVEQVSLLQRFDGRDLFEALHRTGSSIARLSEGAVDQTIADTSDVVGSGSHHLTGLVGSARDRDTEAVTGGLGLIACRGLTASLNDGSALLFLEVIASGGHSGASAARAHEGDAGSLSDLEQNRVHSLFRVCVYHAVYMGSAHRQRDMRREISGDFPIVIHDEAKTLAPNGVSRCKQ